MEWRPQATGRHAGGALLVCEGPLITYVLAAIDACTAFTGSSISTRGIVQTFNNHAHLQSAGAVERALLCRSELPSCSLQPCPPHPWGW